MNNFAETFIRNKKNDTNTIILKKNETLFFEGDLCKEVGFIISGKIEIVSYLEDGKEIIYNTLEDGQMFGNNLVFSSSPYFRGDVVARKDSEIMLIKKSVLLEMLKEDINLLEAYLQNQSDFSKTLNLKIKILTISSAEERLKYYLTFYKEKYTYKSVSEFARTLYLSREALSRTISKMSKNSQIDIHGKTIELK